MGGSDDSEIAEETSKPEINANLKSVLRKKKSVDFADAEDSPVVSRNPQKLNPQESILADSEG